MLTQPSFAAALLLAASLCAPGCTGAPPAAEGGTGGTGAAAGAGGTGGGAGEPLPPLDPAACPVTADSGQDPALAEAAQAQWSPAYVLPESGSIEQDKAFFLATLLRADAALLTGLGADPTLAAISQDRDDRIRAAPDQCVEDVACYTQALGWSAAEAQAAADALEAHLAASGELAAFAADMRASGRFALHAMEGDGALVDVAFRDLAIALGKTFGDEASALGGAAIHDVVAAVVAGHPAPFSFFEPLLAVDLAALAADMRDEGARYEPLEEGENAAALAHIPGIDWEKFPFTVILVPGLGPTSLDVALSPGGQARADLGAQRFAAGIAPLIAVSGGHVHPDRTPYSEAIEMKKYLRDTHGIPEEAILVDPHARHTTTNLRNVSRLLYRHGVPVDRPLLVTSDWGQSIYIGYWKGMFGPRCMEELGYLPWRSLVSISENDACMVPVAVSLHGDGRDPLDP
jgi:hypothetical protein